MLTNNFALLDARNLIKEKGDVCSCDVCMLAGDTTSVGANGNSHKGGPEARTENCLSVVCFYFHNIKFD